MPVDLEDELSYDATRTLHAVFGTDSRPVVSLSGFKILALGWPDAQGNRSPLGVPDSQSGFPENSPSHSAGMGASHAPAPPPPQIDPSTQNRPDGQGHSGVALATTTSGDVEFPMCTTTVHASRMVGLATPGRRGS